MKVTEIFNMFLKYKWIINSYSKQFYFLEPRNFYTINKKIMVAKFVSSKNHKLEFSRVSFYWIYPKSFQHTHLRSYLRIEYIFARFLLQLYSVLSSAKFQISDFLIEKNKSLINLLNSRAPRIEHCGTPVLISYHELNAERILDFCCCLGEVT